MRDGQIIEVGAPKKIYFDSSTASSRIYRARQPDPGQGAGRGGRPHHRGLRARDLSPAERRDLAVGSEATLCIRPEFIRIAKGEAGGKNVVNGRVELLIFIGEAYERKSASATSCCSPRSIRT